MQAAHWSVRNTERVFENLGSSLTQFRNGLKDRDFREMIGNMNMHQELVSLDEKAKALEGELEDLQMNAMEEIRDYYAGRPS